MTEQHVIPVFEGSDVVSTISCKGERDEASEFLSTLNERDQARFQRFLERLRDGYHIKSPENMRHIKGARDPRDGGAEVHELKTHNGGGHRLYLVRYRDRWYLTHGKKKVSDRAVLKEAKKAFRIFWGD
jgi:putative component of toxin-antitoxin plasmid stabilization module